MCDGKASASQYRIQYLTTQQEGPINFTQFRELRKKDQVFKNEKMKVGARDQ